MAFYVETAALEMHGPYTAAKLLEMYHAGEISIFNLVRKAEPRPIEYCFFGELLLEIDPGKEKKEPKPATPFVPYTDRPRHRYGELPREYFARPRTRDERVEDIREFLREKHFPA